jgi:hypothetical protein
MTAPAGSFAVSLGHGLGPCTGGMARRLRGGCGSSGRGALTVTLAGVGQLAPRRRQPNHQRLGRGGHRHARLPGPVGYDGGVPESSAGHLVGSLVALLGIGLFALPASIPAGGFVEATDLQKQEQQRCPHCSEAI